MGKAGTSYVPVNPIKYRTLSKFWYKHSTFVAFCLMPVIRKQWLKQGNYSDDQTARNQRFWPDSAQILRHQYGISAAETQTFLSAKRHQRISKSSKNILYSLIMTVALTSPRQWALRGDDVVVETRVWPNEALFTVWPLKPGPPKNFLLQQIRNRSLINSKEFGVRTSSESVLFFLSNIYIFTC